MLTIWLATRVCKGDGCYDFRVMCVNLESSRTESERFTSSQACSGFMTWFVDGSYSLEDDSTPGATIYFN